MRVCCVVFWVPGASGLVFLPENPALLKEWFMRNWLSDLLGKCEQKGFPEAIPFLKSLQWRWMQADYCADSASELWDSRDPKIAPTNFRLVFQYAVYVEASIYFLNTFRDTLLQVLNVVFMANKYSEEQVGMGKFWDDYKNLPADIIKACNALKDNPEPAYIRAFCNTSKHRALISFGSRMEYGGAYRNDSGVVFEKFQSRGTAYPQTWGIDVLTTYRAQVKQLVDEVGEMILKHI